MINYKSILAVQNFILAVLLLGGAIYFVGAPSVGRSQPFWYSLGLLCWLLSIFGFSAFIKFKHGGKEIDTIAENHPLKATLDSTLPCLFLTVDKNGLISNIEGNALNIFSQSSKSLTNRSADQIFGKSHPILKDLSKAFNGEQVVAEREIFNRLFRCHYFPKRTGDGEIFASQCVFVDISDMVEVKSKLAMTSQILKNSSEAVVVCDDSRHVVSVSGAFSDITGYGPDEVIGSRTIIPEPIDCGYSKLKSAMVNLAEKRVWSGNVKAKHKNGEVYEACINVSAYMSGGAISHYLITFSKLSTLSSKEDELNYIANHDELTGLPNRRLFLDRLSQSIKRAKRLESRFSLFFIDLDNFKIINDNFGHHIGDELLKQIGLRLRQSMREIDTIARFAGDEFTVIVENVANDWEVAKIATKILACFHKPFYIGEEELDAFASVGISVFPADGENAEDLLACADAAMYRAKGQGKNGVCFANEKSQNINFRNRIFSSSELRMAIIKNEFEILYQPLMNIADKRVIGCEALLRWKYKENETLMPAEFLSSAEERGLIGDLGAWVVDSVCKQVRDWCDKGVNLECVSINLAADQLNSERVLDRLSSAIENNRLQSDSFALEVSEIIALSDLERTQKFINYARALGFNFTIDEFGSTGEGFKNLHNLSATMIKLDRHLLNYASAGREAKGLISAIVALSRLLNLTVIAVGVEHQRQEENIGQAGCSVVQGYYYSPPVKADDFLKYYQRYHCSVSTT